MVLTSAYGANEHLVERELQSTGAAAMRAPPFNKGNRDTHAMHRT
jgi:hypothetical protein